jgi:hypothetical protein
MEQCALNEEEDPIQMIMIFMSAPFSRVAADRLERMGASLARVNVIIALL